MIDQATIITHLITLLGTGVGSYFLFRQKKTEVEAGSTKVFHDIAMNLIKDNIAVLQNQNEGLLSKIREIEQKEGSASSEVDGLRREILRQQTKIATAGSMLAGVITFTETMVPKMYYELSQEDFLNMLQKHSENLREVYKALENIEG